MIGRLLRMIFPISQLAGEEETDLELITNPDDLERVLGLPLAVLYKHSPMCPVSSWTQVEVQRFANENPNTAVYKIDVVRDRSISNEVAKRFDIIHQSPQAFVIRSGVPIWWTSHGGITATALEEGIAGVRADHPGLERRDHSTPPPRPESCELKHT